MDKGQARKLRNRVKKAGKLVKVPPEALEPPLDFQKVMPYFDIRCDHHEYCLGNCDTEVKARFADTLHTLGTMTWQQIETTGREALGYEKIPVGQIKANHPIALSKEEKIKVFRLTGKARMAGIRANRRVFTVLWLDPEHSLY